MLIDNRRPTAHHIGYTEGRPMLCVKRANGHPRYVVVQPTSRSRAKSATATAAAYSAHVGDREDYPLRPGQMSTRHGAGVAPGQLDHPAHRAPMLRQRHRRHRKRHRLARSHRAIVHKHCRLAWLGCPGSTAGPVPQLGQTRRRDPPLHPARREGEGDPDQRVDPAVLERPKIVDLAGSTANHRDRPRRDPKGIVAVGPTDVAARHGVRRSSRHHRDHRRRPGGSAQDRTPTQPAALIGYLAHGSPPAYGVPVPEI